MKIRIRDNSLRYRLDKKDINLLQEQQQVASDTIIGAGKLHFCIKARAADAAAIRLENNAVHLSLPLPQVRQWTETDQVGFELELPNTDGSVLKILVEKDFKCLTERGEDESAAFDNPLAKHNC